MPFPSYMQGRPDELMQRTQRERMDQQRTGGGWSPALDALEAFSYQAPEYQNQSYSDMAQGDAAGPISPWQRYASVLGARGVQSPFGAPSSIAQNPMSTWNTNQEGPRPWGMGNSPMMGLQGAYNPQQSAPAIRGISQTPQSRQAGDALRKAYR